MSRFTKWEDAHSAAIELANKTHLNVAIRAVKEFGKCGFNVSFASTSDSDYHTAEIIVPNTPRTQRSEEQ